MLLKLFKSWSGARSGDAPAAINELPEERLTRIEQAHERAPIDLHREILYRNLSVGPLQLNELVDGCIEQSLAKVKPSKKLHRTLSSFFLSQYFLYSLDVEGARAECGVYAGTSALLLCRTAQTRNADYRGGGLHLVDSFQGFSDPTPEDAFASREGDRELAHSWHKGGYAAPIENARTALRSFPEVSFHAGWIPEIFAELPDTCWSFVHLDVDLYTPTFDSLAYFFPRMSKGGVIICDDYGAALFPGAHRAWDEFCDQYQLPYVVLDTGQSVIVKT